MFIRYAQGIGVRKVLLLEDQKLSSDEVVLLDCRNGSRKRFKGRKVLEIL